VWATGHPGTPARDRVTLVRPEVQRSGLGAGLNPSPGPERAVAYLDRAEQTIDGCAPAARPVVELWLTALRVLHAADEPTLARGRALGTLGDAQFRLLSGGGSDTRQKGRPTMTTADQIDANAPTNWGRWGADDELGTLNFITDEARARRVAQARAARVVSMAATVTPVPWRPAAT
jgi:hypothetical protein